MEQNEHSEDIGIVTNVQESVVTVELKKSGACKNCAMSALCMSKDTIAKHEIISDIPLKIGDSVRIYIQPKYKVLSAFLVFIFPILFMIITYLISFYLFQLPEKSSILITLASLFVSGIIIYFCDKKLRKRLQVKIIEKISA